MGDIEIGADHLLFRADVIGAGRSDADLRRDVRTGVVERVWQGAYLPAADGLADHAETVERHRATVIAAARSGGPGRVASHVSGAAMHRIPMFEPDLSKVHFTSATTGKTVARGVIHQARLSESDVVIIDDIPVTSLARTVCDVARTGTLHQAVCVLDSGLHLGVTVDELDEQVLRLRRHHGSVLLRTAVPLANGLSESVGESVSRLVLAEHPLIPMPECQVEICVEMNGRRKVRADFGWRDADGVLRVVGEFDGRFKYHRSSPFGDRLPEDVIYQEKLREDAIRATGPLVVRWTWSETMRPKVLHPKVIAVLTTAGIIA
ncbi:hypothetical protein AAFP35_05210 [Gordonia sp. CPCC 206044]|uniref:hypothetical protein n=1 Tax=Gordonia sp. CPCC 206044 TaxID=3140793 RepID=UPI003AF358F5